VNQFGIVLQIVIAFATIIPMFLYWADTRRRSNEQHTENAERLMRIETELKPIVIWWNQRKNEEHT
jgi:uncharacterized membrane protein